MHNFKKLKIWMESMVLVSESYKITRTFPEFEKFGLASQMNRSAISIPSNIAEGSSKSTNKHFKIYLENSLGSAFEWETQLIIAYQEGYLKEEQFTELEQKIKQLQKMISSFRSNLSN
ncbi:four helix bundle protein [Mangrovimonas sp. AS39]|uniref:four helix bundle protein n=1 Tax=Mangrovimonas futianensis TaxID=2895523 RepID=UPI001E28D564|nr:four helix bundle protein [Mangrovimonas futianensis]MCF1191976.1 four helix bundle protein [Mangrovimonas futianensis]MCF1195670.1 four helix bundle protein [Mangrovimonas futianensis]